MLAAPLKHAQGELSAVLKLIDHRDNLFLIHEVQRHQAIHGARCIGYCIA